MPITVVTVRDDNGAPSTRESYASGDSYVIVDGSLQVVSAHRQLLALYPSGNWLSAYVDTSIAALPTRPSREPDRASEQTATEQPVRPVRIAEPTAEAEAESDARDDGPPAAVVEQAPPSGARETRERTTDGSAPSRWMRPVAFRPLTSKPQRPDPQEPPHERRMMRVVFRPVTAKPQRPETGTGEPGSHLRPVVFRPKPYRVPGEDAERPPEQDDED